MVSAHTEMSAIKLNQPTAIKLSQASSLSQSLEPSSQDLRDVMQGYAAILHGRLEISLVRNLLVSLQLTRFAEELHAYTTKPAHVFRHGVVHHYTEHHLTIKNRQPAYQYTLFCYYLHQFVNSLTDRAVLICDFTNGERVCYE